MKLVIVSSQVGETPEEITYPFVFEEAKRIASRGVDVHVVRFRRGKNRQSFGLYFHNIGSIELSRVLLFGVRVFYHYPLYSLARYPRFIIREFLYGTHLALVLKKLNPDLIHAHFAYPEGWIAYLGKKYSKSEIPVIVTLHGDDILVERSIGYGKRLKKTYDLLIRKTLQKCDAVIVASRSVYMEASKLCDRRKIFLIPNGVDIVRFHPKNDGSLIRKLYDIEDKNVVFTVRRHTPKNGIKYLIYAASIVVNKNRNVIFLIGGDGPLRKYYEELVRKLNIHKNVIFTGNIPQKLLPKYYAASDMVVVPSIQEAWGLVVTEALASGKPVIGSKVGGIVDQIINGYNGFLVPPRNPLAIAEKILYLVENPRIARKMGLNGRKIAEEKFDLNKRIDRIIHLYSAFVKR